jgi:hypothetical protein
MELSFAFFLRLVASLGAFGLAHWGSRTRSSAEPAETQLPAIEVFSLCILGFAAAFVPTFATDLFSTDGNSALAGIWALILFALVLPLLGESSSYLETYAEQGHWLSAWALSLAVPVTLFGQTELDRIGSVQDGLLLDLIPVWGALFQPAAFTLALVAIACWMASRDSRTLSPRRSSGMLNGVLISATVVVFLGAWHIPWITDDKLHQMLGERRWLCALVEWTVFSIKVWLVAGIVGWLSKNNRVYHRRISGLSLSAVALVNLILTWAVLCWRGL